MQQRAQNLTSQSHATQREELKKRLEALTQDYRSASRTLGMSSGVDRERIKRQIGVIEQEMDEVSAALESSEATDSDRQRHLQFYEKLPEINFLAAKEIAYPILDRFDRNGGAALFFLQNSHPMAGDLLVTAIRERLNRDTSNLKHHTIEFLGTNGRLDELGILDRLANRVDVESATNTDQYAQAIIDKICGSVRSGTIVFFEFHRWENLEPQDHLLSWFLDTFWGRLIQKLPTLNQYRCVKFIGMMTSENKLSSACLNSAYFCNAADFDSNKVLDLPLSNWTEDDIERWLERFAGLTNAQINQFTRNAYGASMSGIPHLVRGYLEKDFA